MESLTVPRRVVGRSRIAFAVSLALAIGMHAAAASAEPAAAGFQVETYASVPDPLKITFAPNGELYGGRNPAGNPGGTKSIESA